MYYICIREYVNARMQQQPALEGQETAKIDLGDGIQDLLGNDVTML